MKAVLFVGHGSREKEGNEQVVQMVRNIKNQMSAEWIVETCFLELTDPNMDTGISRCLAQGATSIAIIPMMIFAASHSKLHIPFAIDEARKKYPSVTFTYGRPIGVHKSMVEICEQRIEEGMDVTSVAKDDIGVVLLGRGCSDGGANSDLYKLARLLREKLSIKKMEPAFIAVTEPSLEESVTTLLILGAKKVIVLPYLLFTGVLMKRLEEQMVKLQTQLPQIQLTLASNLGFHPKLEKVFMERMDEAISDSVMMNCDTCRFRMEAAEHMAHHHDHDHHHHHKGHHLEEKVSQ
ncbi:sirohydrochlorin chelatase [Robertmurraya sp. P23]|uniref:sirohydrochlorin chelatase n=1 Tax=Robertmurraya sp. P23 TaxID=3436931 RepID=UPI003D95C5F2